MQVEKKLEQDKPKAERTLKWFWRLFIFFFFFFFCLSTILYLPPIQNLVTDYFSARFSKNINGKFEVGKVRLNIIKGVVFRDLSIMDKNSMDTILYVSKINSVFKENLSSLIQRKLDLKTIEISGISLEDKYSLDKLQSQLSYLLEKKEKPIEQDSIKPERSRDFELALDRVILHDIAYSYRDSIGGQSLQAYIKDAYLSVECIDPINREFLFDEINLIEPIFSIEKFLPLQATDFSKTQASSNSSNGSFSNDSLNVVIKNLNLEDGIFRFNNYEETGSTDLYAFDPSHIEFKKIKSELENISLNAETEIYSKIKSLSLVSGDEIFQINDLSTSSFKFNSRRMEFNALYAETPHSVIRDRLIFKYRSISSFGEFVDKVILEINANKAEIGVQDLQYFASSLKDNPFFKKYKKERFRLNGSISGRVNAFIGDDIRLNFKDQILINGRFSSRNLTDVENALLNADFDNFQISIGTLGEIIPRFSIPANFYKLGNLDFTGRFDGYFQDFVAYGDLSSDLGFLDLDMRLDLKNGAAFANYSGRANLKEIDLATWTGNEDFGLLNASAEVRDGKGLTLETANAELNAVVGLLEFRDYVYQDFIMDGKLERNLFDGNFQIGDPNIDLNFDGTIDFKDSIPAYDFIADINALKLKPLNLVNFDYRFLGSFNISGKGTDLNNIQGEFYASDFVFQNEGKEVIFDSLKMELKGIYPSPRDIVVESSIADFEIHGVYKLEELPDALISGLKTNYPSYTNSIKHIKFENPTSGYDFNLNLDLKDSKEIFMVLFDKPIYLNDSKILARISDESNRSALNVNMPFLEINNNIIENIKLDLFAQDDEAELSLSIDNSSYNDIDFDPIEFSATLDRDKVYFSLFTNEILDSFQNIRLEGQMVSNSKEFKLNIKESGFGAFGGNWLFNEKNNIVLSNSTIKIDDLNISDGEHTLFIEDIEEKGVAFKIEDINADFVERLMGWKDIDLRGFISGELDLENIFDFNGINADLSIPTFGFNRHEFGSINLQIISQQEDDPLAYEIRAIDSQKNLSVKGAYFTKEKQNFAEITVNRYPIDLLEYLLTEGISGTRGVATGRLQLRGPLAYPELSGNLIAENAKTTIDYLGVTYGMGKNNIKFSDGKIDFTDCQLIDLNGNIATINGGLTHNAFRDFATDLVITSDQFIALNTTKAQNPSYYGFAQGAMDVQFSGPFDNINIEVNATTGKNTELYIPVEYTTEEISTSFIEIIDKDSQAKENGYTAPELGGLNLDMNLNVTESSQVSIIFDEAANDKLESVGRGAIQLEIDAEGNFNMLGDYEVVTGQYLFTIPSLLVNKSFIIKQGGKIQWTGDPLDAKLGIQAEYKGLEASLETFLEEYIPVGNDRLLNQARNRTDVSLELDLGGTISNPDINFEISFPELTGELKPLAESKLRTLEASPDAYNDQVFGLILLRNFLPSNNPLSNNFLRADNLTSNLVGTGYSTISEFLSNQTSILLSSLFAEALGDNTFLTGIDVDINATKSQISGDANILPDEYDISLNSSFNDDKWSVQVGGKYVRINTLLSDNPYFAPDMVIEYYITEDRRLKLNFYTRYDLDATQFWKLQSGIGLSYRSEFNTLIDFAKFMKKETKEPPDISTESNL